MLSAAGFGVAFAKPFRDGLKDYSSEAGKYIRPEYGLTLGILALCLTVFSFALILGLWNSRKWALWLVLALHLPGAVFAASNSDIRSAVPAIAVSIYCLLRVTGSLGPKL